MDIETCKIESEKRWAEAKVDIQRIKDKYEELSRKVEKQDAIIVDIQELSKSVALLASNMEGLLKEQKAQNERLVVLEQKPAKRWDAVVDKIIMLVVAALVGALLIKLGFPA